MLRHLLMPKYLSISKPENHFVSSISDLQGFNSMLNAPIRFNSNRIIKLIIYFKSILPDGFNPLEGFLFKKQLDKIIIFVIFTKQLLLLYPEIYGNYSVHSRMEALNEHC